MHNEIFRRAFDIVDAGLPAEMMRGHSTQTVAATADTWAKYTHWIEQNIETAQAGSFFPDWGYQCLSGTSDQAEAAHWPEFVKAAVDHLHEEYGGQVDKSADAQALLVFIFGIVSHQVSDLSWHSLHLYQGFIREMAMLDFESDYQKAHNAADVGGDVILAKRFRAVEGGTDWLSASWKVPIDDMIAIYQRLGLSVSRFALQYCTARGLAALRATIRIGPSLYDFYTSKSPFLHTHLDDYYLGGVNNMATNTVECWLGLARWLELGKAPKDPYEMCDLFKIYAKKPPRMEYKAAHKDEIFESEYAKELALIDIEDNGAKSLIIRSRSGPLDFPVITKVRREAPLTVTTFIGYSEFGTCIAAGDLFNDGSVQLAISAPSESDSMLTAQSGAVYIVDPNKLAYQSTIYHQMLSTQEISPQPGSRFGQSVVCLSLDKNITLLAVGSPGARGGGAVEIFALDRNALIPQVVIKPQFLSAHPGWPGQREFGSKLHAFDIDGDGLDDLIVAAPFSDQNSSPTKHCLRWQSGLVFIIKGSTIKEALRTSPTHLNTSVADWTLEDPESCHLDRFGESIAWSASARVLFIGSPGAGRIDSKKAASPGVGAVMAFKFEENGFAKPNGSISGPHDVKSRTDFGGAGLVTFDIDDVPYVAIGAPGAENDGVGQQGVVMLYRMAMNAFQFVGEIVADETVKGTRFGSHLRLNPARDKLYISSEWAGSGEAGMLWSVDLSHILANTQADIQDAQSSQQVLSTNASFRTKAKSLYHGTTDDVS